MSKLGTSARPAVVKVNTEARAATILKLCTDRGWQVIIGIEPTETEDITDVEKLMNPPQPIASEKIERNAPCPCGSGLKAKKCCYS